MIEILKQGPRLHVEASVRTSDVNEAYLLVHNAMALAMSQNHYSRPPTTLAGANALIATYPCSRRVK